MRLAKVTPLCCILFTQASAFAPGLLPGLLRHKHTVARMSSKENSGHQPSGHGDERSMSPEQQALQQRIQEHQSTAAKLTFAEAVRTLVEGNDFAVISTNSAASPGYPSGSVVGYGLDEEGRPLFAFSQLSSHTVDLKEDGRACLTIKAANFKGASDGRVSLMGDVIPVPEEEEAEIKEKYKLKHPKAFWVDFKDFHMSKLEINSIRFVGGFAMAGQVTAEEYKAVKPDPVAPFAGPVLGHMNADHASSTKAMVEHYITGGVEIESAELVGLDALGLDVLVTLDGQKGKLRLPFPRRATDRGDVKTLIVEMTRASAPASA